MEKGSRYRGVSGTSGLFLSDAKTDPGPFTKKLFRVNRPGSQVQESGQQWLGPGLVHSEQGRGGSGANPLLLLLEAPSRGLHFSPEPGPPPSGGSEERVFPRGFRKSMALLTPRFRSSERRENTFLLL